MWRSSKRQRRGRYGDSSEDESDGGYSQSRGGWRSNSRDGGNNYPDGRSNSYCGGWSNNYRDARSNNSYRQRREEEEEEEDESDGGYSQSRGGWRSNSRDGGNNYPDGRSNSYCGGWSNNYRDARSNNSYRQRREEEEEEEDDSPGIILTASKFGIICGVNPYRSVTSLFEFECAKFHGVSDDDEDNDSEESDWYGGYDSEEEAYEEYREKQNMHIARGIAGEAIATRFYETVMQVTVQRVDTLYKPPYGAKPDGLIVEFGKRRLLEIKCPAKKPPNRIPDTYMCQIQGEMELFNVEHCDFCTWHAQHGLRVWRVKRNRRYWAWMKSQLEMFMSSVVTGELLLQANRTSRPPACEWENLGVFKHHS